MKSLRPIITPAIEPSQFQPMSAGAGFRPQRAATKF
jgi:hypothetical protein